MITVPAGVRIYLARGATDMRRGFDGLAAVTEVACWAHARRYFLRAPPELVTNRQGVPRQAGALFDIERLIAGQLPEQRRVMTSDGAAAFNLRHLK
jgi:hypothetical protein